MAEIEPILHGTNDMVEGFKTKTFCGLVDRKGDLNIVDVMSCPAEYAAAAISCKRCRATHDYRGRFNAP